MSIPWTVNPNVRPGSMQPRHHGKTPRQWVANHEKMLDPPPCEHGHLGCSCSSKEGGPCLDEMLASLEDTR